MLFTMIHPIMNLHLQMITAQDCSAIVASLIIYPNTLFDGIILFLLTLPSYGSNGLSCRKIFSFDIVIYYRDFLYKVTYYSCFSQI